MKTNIIILTCFALSCGNSSSKVENAGIELREATGVDASFNFDAEDLNNLPPGWTAASGTWMVVAEDSGKAMKLTARGQDDFNVCVLNNLNYLNFEMEVRMKAAGGEEDQGGGLVWRYQDSKNYYIARANPLENNFRLYKVVKGRRTELKSASVKMITGEWFSLKVVMKGNGIDCYYGSEKLLSETDDTFTGAGLVGFWTKSDAVSVFDDLKIRVLI
jgi:hypothetical protein